MATLMDEFDAYYSRLKDSIDIVLAREVARAVMDRIENMAEVNVYAAYDPSEYVRRMTLNRDDQYSVSASNMTLEIDNLTTGNPAYQPPLSEGWDPGEIGDLITRGVGYHWRNSKIYMKMPFPRPWMEPGLQDAINDHSAENSLEAGLASMGF